MSSLEGKFAVTDLGEIDGEAAMVDFFRAIDIHLMPSLDESFGMMAMEAAACGVPSVVFSGTTLPEVCFAPYGGIAVERGNVSQLSQALHTLIRDGEKRRDLGQKARVLANANYSFEKYAEAHLRLYEQILKSE